MVNKRGYLRILEAVLAIVLLLGVILFITSKPVDLDIETPPIVIESQEQILDMIAFDVTLRTCILEANSGACSSVLCWDPGLKQKIEDNIPLGYGYGCEICDQSLSCADITSSNDKSIFTSTLFFASDGTNNEKVVRIYFWKS